MKEPSALMAPEEAPTAEPTLLPPTQSPTAVPSVTPLPTPTAVPTTTPLPSPTAEIAADLPALVWLPYGAGSFGEPILAVQEGEVSFVPEPTPVEIFFDYDPVRGRIAYGGFFWEAAENGIDSVTDLWVYSYKTDEAEQWLEDDVGRAVWAPPSGDAPQLAVAEHNGEHFDLVLLSETEEGELLSHPIAENISPFYSWSPEGDSIAFVRKASLFVVDVASGEERGPLADGVYELTGWVGDAPLWDIERGYLIYADEPFAFASLNEAVQFTPQQLDGTPLAGSRPLEMLWSAELRQLISQNEGMFGEDVQIYLLSEDLKTVVDSYFLEGSRLVDWYEAETSIIVLNEEGEPRVWSLVDYAYVEP